MPYFCCVHQKSGMNTQPFCVTFQRCLFWHREEACFMCSPFFKSMIKRPRNYKGWTKKVSQRVGCLSQLFTKSANSFNWWFIKNLGNIKKFASVSLSHTTVLVQNVKNFNLDQDLWFKVYCFSSLRWECTILSELRWLRRRSYEAFST